MICTAPRRCEREDFNDYDAVRKKLRIEKRDARRGAKGCVALQHPFALLDVFERLRNAARQQIIDSIAIANSPETGLCVLGCELPGDVTEIVASLIAPRDLAALRVASKQCRTASFQEGVLKALGSRIGRDRIRADCATRAGFRAHPSTELHALVRKHNPGAQFIPQRTWLPISEVCDLLKAQKGGWQKVLQMVDTDTQRELFRRQFGECELS